MLAANHKFCCKPQKGARLFGSFCEPGMGSELTDDAWMWAVVSAPGPSLASGLPPTLEQVLRGNSVQLERKIVLTACI